MGATMARLRKSCQVAVTMVVTFVITMALCLVAIPSASATPSGEGTDDDEATVVETTTAKPPAPEEVPAPNSASEDPPDSSDDGNGGEESDGTGSAGPSGDSDQDPSEEEDSDKSDQAQDDNSDQSDESAGDSSSDDSVSDDQANQDQSSDDQSQDGQGGTQNDSMTMQEVIEEAEVEADPAPVVVSPSQSGSCPNFTGSATLSGDIPSDLALTLSIVYGIPLDGFFITSAAHGPGLVAGQLYSVSFSTDAPLPVGAEPGYPYFLQVQTTDEQLEVLQLNTNCTTPVDSDNDGINDEDDQCPNEAGPASNNGCPVVVPPVDADNDGVSDDIDQCLNTPANATVDENGCADSQKDSDGDGVSDDLDKCPGTQPGFDVDTNGCIVCPPGTHPVYAEGGLIVNDCEPDAPVDVTVPKPTRPGVIDPPGPNNVSYEPQQDTDSVDWVLNPDGSYDANAKPGHVFDDGSKTVHFNAPTDSYDPNFYDEDGDGVPDALDKCAGTPAGTPVGVDGCPVQVTPLDSDGDGIPDDRDQCPNVAANTPSGCPPIVVPLPAQPGVIDPPGPNNIRWDVPADTPLVVWTILENGNLRGSLTSGDYRFADGSMFVEFCLPVDSYVPPASPAPTAGPTNAVPDYVGTGEGDTGIQSTMHLRVIVALLVSLLAGLCVATFRRSTTK